MIEFGRQQQGIFEDEVEAAPGVTVRTQVHMEGRRVMVRNAVRVAKKALGGAHTREHDWGLHGTEIARSEAFLPVGKAVYDVREVEALRELVLAVYGQDGTYALFGALSERFLAPGNVAPRRAVSDAIAEYELHVQQEAEEERRAAVLSTLDETA